MRILLVEDDRDLGEATKDGLRVHGHTVDWIQDGIEAQLAITQEQFDVIVLDLGLPRKSGIEVLTHVRSKGVQTPVLILTARDAIEDRVNGLDAGADDYMTKPFDLDELAARLRAMQRRSSDRAEPTITYGDISINPASYTVHLKGELVPMTRREFALLQKLLENQGRVLSREHLTTTLYGWGDEIDSNALEVHIHNLRKKFGSKLIRTIRGVGYMVEKE